MTPSGTLALLPLGAALVGCLPADTRPPPGELRVTASSSELTRRGIASTESADGYAITFERVLVSLGRENFGGGDSDDSTTDCSVYSTPNYTRLFDFTRVEEPERLGIAYALGKCAFGFVVANPNTETKLGVGVTAADRELMQADHADRLTKDYGISVLMVGRAEKGGETKRFSFPFRRLLRYNQCSLSGPEGTTNRLELTTGGTASVNVEIQAEALFRDPHAGSPFRFEPYAEADANADGDITLDELFSVPIERVAELGLYLPPNGVPDGAGVLCPDDANSTMFPLKSLGEFAYCALLPGLVRYESAGDCILLVGRRRD